jgi:hypothetical protein
VACQGPEPSGKLALASGPHAGNESVGLTDAEGSHSGARTRVATSGCSIPRAVSTASGSGPACSPAWRRRRARPALARGSVRAGGAITSRLPLVPRRPDAAVHERGADPALRRGERSDPPAGPVQGRRLRSALLTPREADRLRVPARLAGRADRRWRGAPTHHGRRRCRPAGGSRLVYPEELKIRRGYVWSPDSARIAFLELAERNAPTYPITDLLATQASVDLQRYPKPGDPLRFWSAPLPRPGAGSGDHLSHRQARATTGGASLRARRAASPGAPPCMAERFAPTHGAFRPVAERVMRQFSSRLASSKAASPGPGARPVGRLTSSPTPAVVARPATPVRTIG